jgi:excinuclease ABC subunit C
MVVFEKGKPKKSRYRKYRIKTVAAHDDYAYMAEALKRRYGKGEQSKPFPDLLLVDGGKGQLNIALSVIKELKVKEGFEIIGIAKKNEEKGETIDKVYKPGRKNPISFGREGDLLLFLQRIRDEAHRLAISYQRKLRTKTSMRSRLDAIPGIGKKRKEAIFKHFGSIKKIRAATLKELSALPGMNHKAAEAVLKALS